MKKVVSFFVSIVLVVCFGVSSAFALGVSDFKDFYSTGQVKDGGVNFCGNTNYTKPLNPNYVRVKINVSALTTSVDCWIAIGFYGTADKELSPTNADPKGMFFIIRNAAGHPSITAFSSGMATTYFLEKMLMNVTLLHSDMTFELKYEKNVYNLYCNGTKVNPSDTSFANLKPADISNSSGKTYCLFSAYDASNAADRHPLRCWTVKEISDSAAAAVSTTPAASSKSTTSTQAKISSTAAGSTAAASSEAVISSETAISSDESSSAASVEETASSETASSTASTEETATAPRPNALPWIIGIVVVLAAAGAAVYFFVIRKRRA